MNRRTQNFRNTSSKVIDVWIEMNPDLYRLQPQDEISVTFDDDGFGLDVNVTDDGLQLFVGNFDSAVITINGYSMEPANLTPPAPPILL